MIVALWTLIAAAAMTGAGLAALSSRSPRRAGGLTVAVVAAGGLLVILGSDLATIAWLVLAGASLLLVRDAPAAPAAPLRATSLAALGVLVAMVFAAFYRVVLQVDWRPAPPAGPRALTAEVGGRLLTADLGVFLGAALVVAVTICAAIWVASDRAGRKEET
ncbi:MAG TPA: hypothetical protein PLL30_02280 [Candidatus Krumholzibacteria bacterium]|nr:hypothetical protein [Candidatus Krumholzibacteria bacterium]HPD70595.1 hypothetical protein [Candidatus Krumholzibacteria bacterium]HRY39705.1 hypothetical protein [Candidatus Krumholzibacteria bacterium]